MAERGKDVAGKVPLHDKVHEFFPDDLLLNRVVYFLEIPLEGDKRLGREIFCIFLDLYRGIGTLAEMLDLLAVFCREEVQE